MAQEYWERQKENKVSYNQQGTAEDNRDRFFQRSEEERKAEGMLCNWEVGNAEGNLKDSTLL